MVKTIDYPQQTRIIILKDGYIVADIYTNSVHGAIDIDKIKPMTRVDPLDCKVTVELEV